MAENQPRRGGIGVSPGREPWVEWEIDLSPFRDDTVLTHILQACIKNAEATGLRADSELVYPGGAPLAAVHLRVASEFGFSR